MGKARIRTFFIGKRTRTALFVTVFFLSAAGSGFFSLEVVPFTLPGRENPEKIPLPPVPAETFSWPVRDYTHISSVFGPRVDPIDGTPSNHQGVDLAAPMGSEVTASRGGTVEKSEFSSSYGYYILIDHQDGYKTLYAHNSLLLARAGDTVVKDALIALVGKSGRATGPHCHFEVQFGGEKLDPMLFITDPSSSPQKNEPAHIR